jgi:drug/metabolite transporter (DMT)-like permease
MFDLDAHRRRAGARMDGAVARPYGAPPSMPDRSAHTRALALLALLTLVWGTNWPLFSIALRDFSIWTFRVIVVIVAGTALFAVAKLRGEKLRVPRHLWAPLVLASLFNIAIWNILTAAAVRYIPSGQAAVLAYTMPLWFAAISVLLLGERLSARLLLALAFGSGAVVLLSVPNLRIYADAPLGIACGLGAGLFWALGTAVQKRTDWAGLGLSLLAWQITLSLPPILLAAVFFAEWQWSVPSWTSLLTTIYIALIPTCVGTAAWFAIVGLLPANVAALSSIVVPIVAMVSGRLVLDEPLGATQIGALSCSVIALALALFKPAEAARGA